jgi:hypothetical protein
VIVVKCQVSNVSWLRLRLKLCSPLNT